MSLVDIRDLKITFATDGDPVAAVRGVTLHAKPGEVLAIVGESGSGKTVTARSILRLLPETADLKGSVILAGQDVLSLDPHALRQARGRDAAMVFQEPSAALNPVYRVGWQIAEGLRAHTKMTKRQARERAIEVLEKVGIPDAEHRVNHYPHQFSGGQKQRIVIAMALALNPKVIIADEPTTALDVTIQAEILDLLRAVRDEFDSAVILITHNMGVVADLADRVAVMYQGELVEEATVTELFANPKHEYTQALLAAVPNFGTVERDTAQSQERADDTELVLRACALEVTYPGRLGTPPFQAVRKVDFDVAAGEVLGMVGESGSGKTTIGRAIAGLTTATGGSLQVLGHEMVGSNDRSFRPYRSRIGFVFQDPGTSFNPLLTIAQCIAEPLLVHSAATPGAELETRVNALLDAVHLPRSFANRFPHELSGGQRQRASLARALALDPEIVIADEPTSALDVSVQARVLEVFAELQERLGFATLFISHDLAVVSQVADRVAVLWRGELVELGQTRQVLGDPQHTYTQRLLASVPVPDPVRQARRREALGSTLDG